jgi:hypothetical protein
MQREQKIHRSLNKTLKSLKQLKKKIKRMETNMALEHEQGLAQSKTNRTK